MFIMSIGNLITNLEQNISSTLRSNVSFSNGKITINKQNQTKNEIPFFIEDIDCLNNAINVVPKFCSVVLSIKDINETNNLISTCKKIIEKYNYEIDLYKIDNEHLKLSSYGKASHSAHPELGINAISKLIIVLNDVFKEYNFSFNLFSDFVKYIGDDYTGKGLNINLHDESGSLTLNASQIYIQDNKIYIGINLRVPVHTEPEYVISIFKEKFKSDVNLLKVQPALYVEKDNPLVQKLCDIFNETCKTNFEPIAIGGATYARAFPNCISFGMNFPNDEDMCHKADEFVQIDKLLLSTNIYAKAIWELM